MIEGLLSSTELTRIRLTTEPLSCVVAYQCSNMLSQDTNWVTRDGSLNSDNLIVNSEIVTDVQVKITDVQDFDLVISCERYSLETVL